MTSPYLNIDYQMTFTQVLLVFASGSLREIDRLRISTTAPLQQRTSKSYKSLCVKQEEEEKSKPTPPPPASRGRGRGGGGGRGRGGAGGATEEEEEAEEETPKRGAAGGRGQKRKQQQQDVSTHCQISDFHHTLVSLLTHLSKIIPHIDSEFLTQDPPMFYGF